VSLTYVSTDLRRQVKERADGRCEYCLLSEADAFFTREVDHVIAEKHGGATTFENLALACFDCNRFKRSDIASINPDTGEIVALFNPRTQIWSDHFAVAAGVINLLTNFGETTVHLLKMNLPERVETRKALAELGRYR